MSEVIHFRARPAKSSRPPAKALATESVEPIWGLCPWSDALTDYDKRHMSLFARLLDDEVEGASEADIARDVFGLTVARNPGRAHNIVRSHLKRAHWIADKLFPLLGW